MAIVLVLAYHVAPATVPGGFVGVDVFFVLSGFLITRILCADSAPGRLRRFYGRRIRRLAPALVSVLGATLLIGRATLGTEALQELSRHTVASALFVANLVFWRESGYFDSAAIDKPLLHLWSLGIEEQFYFVWPVCLGWLSRRAGRALPFALGTAGVSFALCLIFVESSPDAVFYLPWFRIWEPLAGAALALAFPVRSPFGKPAAELASTIGLAAIAASALAIGPGSPFPSWSALLPVVGTVLLVAAGPDTLLGKRLLSSRPAIGLGKISYPLYLWHWPLVSLLGDSHPTAGVESRARLVLLSVALSTLTYVLLERPVRSAYRQRPILTGTVLSLSMLAVTVFALFRPGTDTSSALRRNPGIETIERAQHLDVALRWEIETRPCPVGGALRGRVEPFCVASGPHRTRPLLIWGDSTAEAWAPLVQRVAAERGQSAVVFSFSGCPPLFEVRGPLHPGCGLEDTGWKRELIEALRPSDILVSARWSAYLHETLYLGRTDAHFVTTRARGAPDRESSRAAVLAKLPPTLEWLSDIAPVLVLASVPDLQAEVQRALTRGLEHRTPLEIHRDVQRPVADLVADIAGRDPRVSILDPAELLCETGMCTGILGETVVYLDDNHVTAQGALLFRDALIRALEAAEHSRMAVAE